MSNPRHCREALLNAEAERGELIEEPKLAVTVPKKPFEYERRKWLH
jgi:hypothetical protein